MPDCPLPLDVLPKPLQKHADEAIRNRATKLFAGQTLARRQEVVDAYQQALDSVAVKLRDDVNALHSAGVGLAWNSPIGRLNAVRSAMR